MDKLAGSMGFMDLDQELSRADAESVSSDNTVTSGSNGNVQVVVRVRPPSSRERDQGYLKCVGVDSTAHSATLNFRPQPRTFTFDYVADEAVGQEEIFASVGKPITDACLQGYHCCLIAYGQTGAGKTFTMEGPDSDSSSGGSPGFLAKANLKKHEKRGLIPRILDYIFQKMASEKTQNCKDVEFVVKCSYLQIYNEQVSDLLDPGSYNLTIHEDAKAGMHVEGLQEVVVPTAEATYGVFRRGSENRHVGMTAMNLESSRSHSVFTVVVESQRRNDGGVMNRRTSRFYLVDLAGSERQKHSESAGIRLKEAGSINKSLSALGNVIKALVDISEGKIRHVPYRDSKLTFLLKDALGGNSKCTLIANISPAEKNIDETLSTLKFAQRAKLIHNTAVVNEDMFGNPAVMGEEIRRLRLEIAALRANVGSGAGGDQSPMSGQEPQSESVRTLRLEHIISQSVKRSLEAERKNAMEMKVLDLKLTATQAMCERLEKTLQSQKMIIRLRENTIKRIDSGRPNLLPEEIVQDMREEIEQLRKQIEHHPDVVRFKMELDLCRGQLDEYEDERKDDELLSQIAQLENLNQTLRTEFQEMVEEKAKVLKGLDEVTSSRDERENQLSTFEEQFVVMREAMEKYRIEAAEALHKQEKAEEKLQECIREQDEVWRRSNLAEAQATEYAQELTALRSQSEKLHFAFDQQSKLQEDIYLELQKTVDELENSKQNATRLQTELDDARACQAQTDIKLSQAEEARIKATRSLEEMVATCEQLAASVKEKDGVIVSLSENLEAADQASQSFDDRLSAISMLKVTAEESRDAALRHRDDLLQSLSEQSAEKERRLEEERRSTSESIESLRSEMDTKVQQINLMLQEKLLQLEEVGKLWNQEVEVQNEKESSRRAAELEARHLHDQLEQVNLEVSAQRLEITKLSSSLESSEAQLAVFAQEKSDLESKLAGLEVMPALLNAAKCGKEDAETSLSATSNMLVEAKANLEAAVAENSRLRCAVQESEAELLIKNSNFESLKAKYEALDAANQTVKAEISRKCSELEAVTRRESTLNTRLSEEQTKGAAVEKHIKGLMETIENLHADVAAMEGLKLDLLEKTKEVELLEQHAAEQLKHVIIAENARQIDDSNEVCATVKSGDDDDHLLSDKIADLEVASTAMQGIIRRLEDERDSLQSSMIGLQKEQQRVKTEEAVLRDAVLAKDEALLMKASDLENLKSKFQQKGQEIQALEVKLSEQSQRMEAAERVHQALEADHDRLVRTSKSLEDEKEMLKENLASMEVASKEMEGFIESLRKEKVVLETSLGSRFEHLDRSSTEEQVKDVDISGLLIPGDAQVCVSNGTHDGELSVAKRCIDEGDEDRRSPEQGTDARPVAGLPAIANLQSDVDNACKIKMDPLKSHADMLERSRDALASGRDVKALRPLINDDSNLLAMEETTSRTHRNSPPQCDTEACRRHEDGCAEVKRLEKELESTCALLDNLSTGLEYFESQVATLTLERDVLSEELKDAKAARASFNESKSGQPHGRMKELDEDLRLLRIALDEAVRDANKKETRLEDQERLIGDVISKLVEAESRLSEEETRVSHLKEKLELEAAGEVLNTEKFAVRSHTVTELKLLAEAEESQLLNCALKKSLGLSEAEKSKLGEELEACNLEIEKMSEEIEVLIQRFIIGGDQIAELQSEKIELSRTVDFYTSRVFDLEVLLRNAVSDHDAEVRALTSEVHERELQNVKIAADLQELRDEVQYSLGEVEYEFQKYVIDTEARMVDLENQKKTLRLEALELITRTSSDNSKFAGMLGALEEQIVDHHGRAQSWVENFVSMKSEFLHLKDQAANREGYDSRVKELEELLLAERKAGVQQKEEISQLRARVTEQVKSTNPFSWNNNFGSSRDDARSVNGVPISTGIDSIVKEDFVPKFAAPQRKRVATLSKDRPHGKSKTSESSQPSFGSSVSRPPMQSLPLGQGSTRQISRSYSRLRGASQAEKSKMVTPATQSAGRSRQPLRPLSSNKTEETNRRSPLVPKSRYNLRTPVKFEEETSTPLEPSTRNNKRRRLA